MVLPSTGPISFSQIITEFNLSGSLALSKVESLGISGIPTSGVISISQLLGKSASLYNTVIYPTRQIEEVGSSGSTSSVTYFWMYLGNSSYTVNGVSLTTAFTNCSYFRIANWQGVSGQYSPNLYVTSVNNPRSGNSQQIQVNFTPTCVMNPYTAVTFELDTRTAAYTSVIYPTRQIEEVGSSGSTSSVTYFWMYLGNSSYTVNGVSLTTAFTNCAYFRIANWQGVSGQYSPKLYVTSVNNPRSGNSQQIQVNFTPACIMNPYTAVTFELDS